MAAVALASVFVLFFLTVLVAVVRNASAGNPYYEYGVPAIRTYYMQNPRALDPNCAVNDRFTIHGLFMAYGQQISPDRYAYVECCNSRMSDFRSRNELTSGIRANLNYSWPDAFDAEQNFSFWNRQYYKHGSCTKLIFATPETYFSPAEVINISHARFGCCVISNGGIGPGQPFPTATYMNLVQTAIGGLQPQLLLCNGQALREVVLCYDKLASARINCPQGSTCQGNIYLPR